MPENMRQNSRLVTHYLFVPLSLWRFRNVYGGKKRPYLTARVPAITLTCPITTMLIVDHVLKQFYCSDNNSCNPIEYTLKGKDIEPAGSTFTQAQ